MGKTVQVAADRAHDDTKTVVPAELVRGIYIENPPGAQALKLMHLLISIAGGRMADDVQHELRMADMKAIEGMRNHDRATLRALLGVPAGKLDRFSNLNTWALKPAIAEINHLSRMNLTVTPKKAGRTVAAVEIGWAVKGDATATC